MPEILLTKGLPANQEAEQMVLGSILLEPSLFAHVAGRLTASDFSLESHRRIFQQISEMNEAGQQIEEIALGEALQGRDWLQSVGGRSYISSLTTGLPKLSSIDSYISIVLEKSLLRRVIHTCNAAISRCVEQNQPAIEILGSVESDILNLGQSAIAGQPLTPEEIVQQYPGGTGALLNPSTRDRGLQTPFLRFNEMTSGLHPGDLMILAARPSQGKTAMALNIACDVATGDYARPVAFFSLEMSKESLISRLLCSVARVDAYRHKNGYLNDEERRRLHQGLDVIVNARMHIDESANTNLMEIAAKCRRLSTVNGLSLVIVDYLQLMGSHARSENRNQEVSAISRGLKMLAKDLRVPVIALSQLNRAPEVRSGDKRPQLSDLRDSGAIEQDADVVAFIFREEVYKPDREDLHGLAELIIAKQRNGPTGIVRLAFINKFTRFENLAEDIGAEAA